LELDPSIFYPIAACPYLLFPGEKKPISKLLSAAELPLRVDIEHEYVPLNPEIGPDDGEPIKRKVTIPFAELDKIDASATRGKYKFLLNYLKQRESELQLPKEWQDSAMMQSLLFMVCTVKAFTTPQAIQTGI